MAQIKKTWIANPKRTGGAAVPEITKKRLTDLASELIENKLRRLYVKPCPKKQEFNYIADLYPKWHKNYFYLCAEYRSPDATARVPKFEEKFARLEYLTSGKYNLSYMRHTGKWWETEKNISAAKAFQIIQQGGLYLP